MFVDPSVHVRGMAASAIEALKNTIQHQAHPCPFAVVREGAARKNGGCGGLSSTGQAKLPHAHHLRLMRLGILRQDQDEGDSACGSLSTNWMHSAAIDGVQEPRATAPIRRPLLPRFQSSAKYPGLSAKVLPKTIVRTPTLDLAAARPASGRDVRVRAKLIGQRRIYPHTHSRSRNHRVGTTPRPLSEQLRSNLQ